MARRQDWCNRWPGASTEFFSGVLFNLALYGRDDVPAVRRAVLLRNTPYFHFYHHHHHHHHKHQGLDPLIRSFSRVITALANVSSVFQLFSFLVVRSDMISKGFGFLAFFASVKASSVCIRLSCLVCIRSVVHGVWSLFFVVIKGVASQRSYFHFQTTNCHLTLAT